MKAACSAGRSAAKLLLKMRGIEVGETVCRFLYRTRFAEVTREALAVVSLILSGIWHVGRNVHQTSNGWIGAGFVITAPP